MMKSTNLYIFIILFILFSIPLKKKHVLYVRIRTFFVRYRTLLTKLKNVSSLLISALSFWHGFCSIIYIEE